MLFPSSGTTQYLSLGRLEKVISFIGEQNSKTTIHAFPLSTVVILNTPKILVFDGLKISITNNSKGS